MIRGRLAAAGRLLERAKTFSDREPTNRLLIIAAAVVLALILAWYLLPASTPTAPTATPPATTPEQPQ